MGWTEAIKEARKQETVFLFRMLIFCHLDGAFVRGEWRMNRVDLGSKTGKSIILFHVVSSEEEEDVLVQQHQRGAPDLKHAFTSDGRAGPAFTQGQRLRLLAQADGISIFILAKITKATLKSFRIIHLQVLAQTSILPVNACAERKKDLVAKYSPQIDKYHSTCGMPCLREYFT